MVEANRAYALGDEERLRGILQAWENSPDAVPDSDPDAARQRLRRRIAEAEEQLAACQAELTTLRASSIGQLLVTPTCRNLVRVFELRERLRNLAPRDTRVARVHVVGAGTMGGDIAAWCALRGLTVTLQDRAREYVEPALARAREERRIALMPRRASACPLPARIGRVEELKRRGHPP